MKAVEFYRCTHGIFVTKWYSYKEQARAEAKEHGWPKHETQTETMKIRHPLVALLNLLNS